MSQNCTRFKHFNEPTINLQNPVSLQQDWESLKIISKKLKSLS